MRLSILAIVFLGSSILCGKVVGDIKHLEPFSISYVQGEETLTIRLKNKGAQISQYYDSFHAEEDKIPSFLWIRVCNKPETSDCDNDKWVSPHYRTSSFSQLPVAMTAMDGGGVIEKKVSYRDMLNASGINYEVGSYIQVRTRVFLDEFLTDYSEFVSEWIPIK